MIKSDLYPELADIAKNSSYEQIFKVLYTLSLSRYATAKQLREINHRVCVKKFLVKLIELGYLSTTKNLQAFTATPKAWEVLQAEGYNTKIIHKTLEAEAPQHELDISNALLQIYKEEHFFTNFYPHFGDLIPDACLVYRRDQGEYRIVFLEVENKKFDWENYIKKKYQKYQELGTQQEVYTKWWKRWSGLLGLPYCEQDKFCFSVRIWKN